MSKRAGKNSTNKLRREGGTAVINLEKNLK